MPLVEQEILTLPILEHESVVYTLIKKPITRGIDLDLDSIWFIVGLIVFKIEILLCFENR
jgi:hypothetical protein